MHDFPRAARRRLVAATSVAVLALGALTVPTSVYWANAADDLEDRADEVEKKIDSAETDLTESSARARRTTVALQEAQASLTAARERLAEVRAELADAREEDDRMAQRLVEARAALEQAREELERGSQDVVDQQDAVAQTVVDLYTGTDPSLAALSSLLNSQDTSDLTRRDEANDSMVGAETRAYDELRAAEVLLTVNEESVEKAEELVAQRRQEARENLETQRRLTTEQETQTAEVADLVSARRTAQQAADRARAADEETLQELEAEGDRIEQMLRDRAAAAGAVTGTGGAPPSQGGFLGYPVDGYVTSPYGMRTHPIYGYYSLHDGTDFGAACGTPMYAGAAGTVVESYYSTSYGNRLILDHGLVQGVGLASIFNHATNYVVSPGQRVAKGQVVGYVGSTGWSTGCHLHFTVTVNGSTVDPMNWL